MIFVILLSKWIVYICFHSKAFRLLCSWPLFPLPPIFLNREKGIKANKRKKKRKRLYSFWQKMALQIGNPLKAEIYGQIQKKTHSTWIYFHWKTTHQTFLRSFLLFPGNHRRAHQINSLTRLEFWLRRVRGSAPGEQRLPLALLCCCYGPAHDTHDLPRAKKPPPAPMLTCTI